MQPDSEHLLQRIDLTTPLIGFYDAPDVTPFKPLVQPESAEQNCVFTFYNNWLAGETLHLTREHFGCGGAGHWLCGVMTRSREDFITFLVDGEGLKASRDIMNQWIDFRF